MVKQSLMADINSPLDKIQRTWLRRTATLLIFPLILVIGVFFGALEATKLWFKHW